MNFEIEGIMYNIIVNRKNNKNLYIRITENLDINVSCSYFYTNKMILKVLNENKESIISMIEKQKEKNEKKQIENHMFMGKKLCVTYTDVKKTIFDGNNISVKDEIMLDKWYKNMAKEVFKNYLDEAYYVFDEKIPYPKLKIRSMKTRWGVCNRRDNSITLNLELIKKDHKYLNYVIVHELSHFVHFNHSKAFWKTVEKYCPEYKLVRKELRE